MQITPETIKKVMLQYHGQKVMFGFEGNKKKGILTGNCDPFGMQVFDLQNALIPYHNVDMSKERGLLQLILKPLSQISDEDAIEVAKMFYGYNEQYYPKGDYEANQLIIEDAKAILFKDAQDIIGKFYMCIGFLQSKGYDLPHYLLNGKTLHESNLAVYE